MVVARWVLVVSSTLLVFCTHFTCGLYEKTLVIHNAVHEPDGYPIQGISVSDKSAFEPLFNTSQVPGNDTIPQQPHLPGPTIRVKMGERVRITVVNTMADASTTVHWHGLHQKGSQWMDGVPGLTQCNIPPGGTFVYDFVVNQSPGTYFYHSHTATQYGAGLTGVFIVEYPTLQQDPIYSEFAYAADYPVMLQDWNHAPYIDLELKYKSRVGTTPGFKPDYALWPTQSVLFNGKGQFECGFLKWNGTAQVRSWVSQADCDVVNRYGWEYWQTGVFFNSSGKIDSPVHIPGTLGAPGQCHPLPNPFMGTCSPAHEDKAEVFDCPAGQTIRLRFVNSAAGLPMAIWADRHNVTVVAVDGNDVIPANIPVVLLAIGQRIDVILNCSQDPQYQYKLFSGFSEAFYPGTGHRLPNNWRKSLSSTHPVIPPPGPVHAYSLLRYVSGGTKATAVRVPLVSARDMAMQYRSRYGASLGSPKHFLPMFFFDGLRPKTPTTAPPAVERVQLNIKSHGNYPGYWSGSCPSEPLNASSPCSWTGMRFEWWTINGEPPHRDAAQAFTAPNPTPVLLANYMKLDEKPAYPVPTVVTLEYDPVNPKTYEIVLVNYEPQHHPFHFHGYSLYVIGYGYWTTPTKDLGWTTATYNSGWYLHHRTNGSDPDFIYVPSNHGLPELNETVTGGILVDSFTVPPRGFAVVRLVANNPGVWFVHCHMELHLFANMAFMLRVARPDGSMDLPPPPTDFPVCGNAVATYRTAQQAESASQLNQHLDRIPLTRSMFAVVVACGGVFLLVVGFAAGRYTSKKGSARTSTSV